MWITILTIVIPILLKLAEYLFKKQASGGALSDREQRIVNKLNHAQAKVRTASVALGCKPDGEPEVVTTSIAVAEPDHLTPLTWEQFQELQRLIKLGDAVTQAEIEAFEKWVNPQ